MSCITAYLYNMPTKTLYFLSVGVFFPELSAIYCKSSNVISTKRLLTSGAHRRNAALYPFILLSDTVGKCSALQRSYTSCNVILDDSKSNGDLLYSASASSALFLVS